MSSRVATWQSPRALAASRCAHAVVNLRPFVDFAYVYSRLGLHEHAHAVLDATLAEVGHHMAGVLQTGRRGERRHTAEGSDTTQNMSSLHHAHPLPSCSRLATAPLWSDNPLMSVYRCGGGTDIAAAGVGRVKKTPISSSEVESSKLPVVGHTKRRRLEMRVPLQSNRCSRPASVSSRSAAAQCPAACRAGRKQRHQLPLRTGAGDTLPHCASSCSAVGCTQLRLKSRQTR